MKQSPATGLESRVTRLLALANADGGFPVSLVCTGDGLLVASAGKSPDNLEDQLAALAALFEDVVHRAGRDLGMRALDELALRDGSRGRLVMRPIVFGKSSRMFLVLEVPPNTNWRRTTNRLCLDLATELADLAGAERVA